MGKGLSRGRLDKLGRRVQRKLDQGIKVEDMTRAEQMYLAYEVNGLACPSSQTLQKFQVYDKIPVVRGRNI